MDVPEGQCQSASSAATDGENCSNNELTDVKHKGTKCSGSSSHNGSTGHSGSNSLSRVGNKQLKRQRSLGNPADSTSASSECLSTNGRLEHVHRRTSLGSGTKSYPGHVPRETKMSIRRKQLAHSNSQSADERETYLTPFQRKEETIRDLRRALKESHDKLRQKDREIRMMISEKDVELSKLLADKDDEIHALTDRVRELEQECARLREDQDRLKDERDCMKLKSKELELDLRERLEREQEMYLLTYQKGKRSADFERQDTLEELASQDPKAVPVPELVAKLEQMQERLAELQTTTRINQYQDGLLLSPRTDNETKLRVIKDALFHYLTSEGQVARTQNLTILLGLAAFTDVQRRKIETTLSKTKTKKTKKNH
ncbi:hypothetical protein LSH36_304g03053 [Paralvinella palmiformis]|uniref:GRIP domain-containing protein n=1 Tax=Paralvinella palmiformis TaxID=53620 RepID=A0AAD9JIB3_9ANNE|nr:hypothetical protein LSH36_304g03053 [Paralvinella palmiformis]